MYTLRMDQEWKEGKLQPDVWRMGWNVLMDWTKHTGWQIMIHLWGLKYIAEHRGAELIWDLWSQLSYTIHYLTFSAIYKIYVIATIGSVSLIKCHTATDFDISPETWTQGVSKPRVRQKGKRTEDWHAGRDKETQWHADRRLERQTNRGLDWMILKWFVGD